MRSMLVALGYPLYSQVSSDQPPLFTQILALVLRLVGFEVNPARLLVLLFSTLLVWSGAQFLQMTWGKLAAILFLPLFVMVPRYLELSVSVMIGVPSIALAAVAMLFLAFWHQQKRNLWLVLSGASLALSLLVKLFTGFLVPIFLAGILAAAYFERKEAGFSWKMLQPALIWGLSFGGVGIILGLILVGPQNVWMIVFPPLAAPSTADFQDPSFTINNHLQAAIPLLILGLLGALIAIYRKNWLSLYPLAWSVLAYAFLRFYSPVFYHHQLLITIPIAILAAAAVGDGIRSLVRLKRVTDLARFETILGSAALIGFILVSIHSVPLLDKELMNHPRITDFTLKATPGKLRVLRVMGEYADQTNWIMTDAPMYAFRVGRPVPPDLATFSSKRLATGSLTPQDILSAMREYHPEQVLIARFEIPAVEDYLKENYRLILSVEYFRLFLRNDLKTATN